MARNVGRPPLIRAKLLKAPLPSGLPSGGQLPNALPQLPLLKSKRQHRHPRSRAWTLCSSRALHNQARMATSVVVISTKCGAPHSIQTFRIPLVSSICETALLLHIVVISCASFVDAKHQHSPWAFFLAVTSAQLASRSMTCGVSTLYIGC